MKKKKPQLEEIESFGCSLLYEGATSVDDLLGRIRSHVKIIEDLKKNFPDLSVEFIDDPAGGKNFVFLTAKAKDKK